MYNQIFLDLEKSLQLVQLCGKENWKSEYTYKKNKETDNVEMLPSNISHAFTHDEIAPVITLPAMLNNICSEYEVDDVECFLNISPVIVEKEENIYAKIWSVVYQSVETGEPIKTFLGDDLIDAAYDALVWLYEDLNKNEE